MSRNFLNEIIDLKKEEIAVLKKKYRKSDLQELGGRFPEFRSLQASLTDSKGIGIIAEIKKASPSKGLLRKDFHPEKIADIYINEAVAGISVLTEEHFFLGSPVILETLALAKVVPLLRKDFIIDELQIYQSKSLGADCILLISELLETSQIAEYTHLAKELKMDVLLELHSENQLQKINFSINSFIGINNRDLTTFTTSLDTTNLIAKKIPDSITKISESGISSHDDVKRIRDAGLNGILVGEHFMRSDDIRSELKRFKDYCENED